MQTRSRFLGSLAAVAGAAMTHRGMAAEAAHDYSDGKLDPVDDAASVDGAVAGVGVKDFRPPKDVALTPGTGTVDFPHVLERLKHGGFTRGPLVVECLAPGDLAQVNAEAVKSRQFLESLAGQKA